MSKVQMTVQQILDLDLWEKVCDFKRWNYHILNEGRISRNDLVEFDTSFEKEEESTTLEENLKVFICTDHDGFYPVGVCSIIVARDADDAKELLEVELEKKSLSTKEFTLQEVNLQKRMAEILLDGDY